jgi:hypothetical protein
MHQCCENKILRKTAIYGLGKDLKLNGFDWYFSLELAWLYIALHNPFSFTFANRQLQEAEPFACS